MIKLKRRKCAVLPLVLKRKWYDLIEDGFKYEEYRTSETVLHQIQRWWGRANIEKLKAVVEFRRGYGKDAPRMAQVAENVYFRDAGDYVHPELGEPTDKPHYAIFLAGLVELDERGVRK